jgi:hypothetical protein
MIEAIPLSTIATLLPFKPSKVQVDVELEHLIVTAFFIHNDVAAELAVPVQETPVYAVVPGFKIMMSSTAAVLYAPSKSAAFTIIGVATNSLPVAAIPK